MGRGRPLAAASAHTRHGRAGARRPPLGAAQPRWHADGRLQRRRHPGGVEYL